MGDTPGVEEPTLEEQIAAYLYWARRNPERLRAMGLAARDFVRREHSLERVGRMYADALRSVEHREVQVR